MICDEQALPGPIPGYELIRPLGEGGMGRVYLARQRSLDRPVAIKFLTPARDVSAAEAAARFEREARLMARINHPHIVRIYDFGFDAGRPYLVMEYVEGRDLRHLLDQGGTVSPARVASFVPLLADALHCLHRNGIIHRDLKPDNILVDDHFRPKVTDFGIAVDESGIGTLTGNGQWLGTVGYVAPEVQYRLKVDERADQYSLAAVVYELLTGQRPLGAFKAPSRLNPALPPALDDVLTRALQEDRDDRYATILEFSDALRRALRGPGQVRPSRRLALASAIGLTALAGLGLLGFGFFGDWGTGAGQAATPEPRLTNSLGMTLVLVPSGDFLMGSPGDDPLSRPEERPQHPVRLRHDYYLGTREVTVGQFRVFVEATGYQTEVEASGEGGYIDDPVRRRIVQDPSFCWRHPDRREAPSPDEPVAQVTWNDANAFCQWLSRLEERTYRLPTEAEWERACRAAGSTQWSSGDTIESLDPYAWIGSNSGGVPHTVGLKKPNDFGLFDMHGNVWEWCLDRYGPYPVGRVIDPVGPDEGSDRVLRGGSWERADLARTRSAARLDARPNFACASYGFRVCAPLPPLPDRHLASAPRE